MPDTNSKETKKSSKNRLIVFAVAVLLIVALIAGIFIWGKHVKNKAESSVPTTQQTTETPATEPPTTQAVLVRNINPLTGLPGFNEAAFGKRPIAVVVENSPDARPQWGLCSPDIVIEGVVEGGITRMLWLYADVNTMPKVGPVRSARHDFVEMAEGLNATYIHWGGSQNAYDAIAIRKIDHIDGMDYSGKYFFRDNSRNVASEHTGYTKGESIAKGLSDLNINTELNSAYYSPFKFSAQGTPVTLSGGTCQSIALAFSSNYKHTFKFNSADKLYYNYINSKSMVEDGGKQMSVTNVIVLYCLVTPLNDYLHHIEMDLTGGNGVLAANGGYENITWKKGAPNDMLKLYSADGSELKLNAGKSFIGFVPTSQADNTVIN